MAVCSSGIAVVAVVWQCVAVCSSGIAVVWQWYGSGNSGWKY